MALDVGSSLMSEDRHRDAASEAPRWVFRRAACNADSLLEKDVRQLVERDTEDMNKLLECRGEKYRYEVLKEKLTLRVVRTVDGEPIAEASFGSTDEWQLRFSMPKESDVCVTPRWDAREMRCNLHKPGPAGHPIALDVFVRENLERFFFGAAGIP